MFWVFGNWKMNGTLQECEDFVRTLDKILKNEKFTVHKRVSLGVAPPFPYIFQLRKISASLEIPLLIGAQNCSAHPEGSFTGEVSAPMLADLDLDFAILGHSECRNAGESNQLIGQKIKQALDAGLKVIFCIGEKEDSLPRKDREEFMALQITQSLSHISPPKKNHLFIAYEPVWSIGTGRIPSPDYIQNTLAFCKKTLASLGWYEVPLLYGGSVTPENIHQILSINEVSGALVGKASLSAAGFFELARNCP